MNLKRGTAALVLLAGAAIVVWLRRDTRVEVPPREEPALAARLQREAHVILLTIDGPVTADVLTGPRMPNFHRALGQHGVACSGTSFIAALGPLVHGGVESSRIDQRDVRPTIERLLGLCAEPRSGGGHPITAIAGDLPCSDR